MFLNWMSSDEECSVEDEDDDEITSPECFA